MSSTVRDADEPIDFSDPAAIIARYLPSIRGHVVNRYSWLKQRDCLLTEDDVMQVAAIVLVNLARKWQRKRPADVRDEGAFFWRYLEKATKGALLGHVDEVLHGRPEHVEAIPDDIDSEFRTSIRAPDAPPHWRLLLGEAIDYWAIMPRRQKAILALRYFDELTWDEVAAILGSTKGAVYKRGAHAAECWRQFAVALFTTRAAIVPRPIRGLPWEEPEKLGEYVRARHQSDVAEWLGHVDRCFRADVSYLVDIMKTSRHDVPGAITSALSAVHQAEADEMLRAGRSQADVARKLGVSHNVVHNHSKRRRAI